VAPKVTGAKTDAQRQRDRRERLRRERMAELRAMPDSPLPGVPGHVAAVTHGADRAATVSVRARQCYEAMMAAGYTPAYLRDPVYAERVLAYCHAYARVELIREFVDKQDMRAAWTEVTEISETQSNVKPGVIKRQSKQKSAVSAWDRLEAAEKSLAARAAELGLTPMARARLGKDFAKAAKADLALIWAEEDKQEGA
jgi:phage terminase small subunit